MTNATFATDAPRVNVTAPALHITAGNSKLGRRCFNISKLPGMGQLHYKSGELITNVCGSCPADCKGCYAKRSLRFTSTVKNWAENTLLAQDPREFFIALRDWCDDHKRKPGQDVAMFRINQSGDVQTGAEWDVYAYIAENYADDFIFYGYTKNWSALREFMSARDWEKPVNLNIMLSEAPGYPAPADLKEHFPVCVWDQGQTGGNGETDPRTLPHCPAVTAPCKPGGKGHTTNVTCDKCKLCTRGVSMAIYNH